MTLLIHTSGPSNGAVALRNVLRERGLTAKISRRTTFRRRPYVINWGTTHGFNGAAEVLNTNEAVATARNKLLTFNTLKEQGFEHIPDFWTAPPSSSERGKSIILERHSLTGQSGSGIRVKRRDEALDAAPLYVRYIKKSREFRVHVFRGQVVAVQEKRRERDNDQTPDQKLIRNHANGWVFCVLDVQEPSGLRDIAVDAIRKLDLDFGAVDMILSRDNRLYVLEVNTRPGLESPTVLSAYADAIHQDRNPPDDNRSDT